MIIFSVSALDKAPVTLKGSENETFFDLADNDPVEIISPMNYELTGSKVSGGVLVTGSCSVDIAGSCGRCLGKAELTVEATDIELFFEVAPTQEHLDISEDIRAEVLLEFPMNMLCSEDCLGLCPECGADLNNSPCDCDRGKNSGDMRWSALDDLKL